MQLNDNLSKFYYACLPQGLRVRYLRYVLNLVTISDYMYITLHNTVVINLFEFDFSFCFYRSSIVVLWVNESWFRRPPNMGNGGVFYLINFFYTIQVLFFEKKIQ